MDQATVDFYRANASSVASRYESVVSSLSDHFLAAFLRSSKILDIGFGSGRDLAALAKLGHDCYGVDPTQELIEQAEIYHPDLKGRLVKGSLPHLVPPFRGDFDGVLCSAVLMHLPAVELPAAAVSIKDCLKPKGRILYSVPCKRDDLVGDDRDGNGRLFVPDQQDRIQQLFHDLGFTPLAIWTNADSMGRDAVEWKSVLMERGTQ